MAENSKLPHTLLHTKQKAGDSDFCHAVPPAPTFALSNTRQEHDRRELFDRSVTTLAYKPASPAPSLPPRILNPARGKAAHGFGGYAGECHVGALYTIVTQPGRGKSRAIQHNRALPKPGQSLRIASLGGLALARPAGSGTLDDMYLVVAQLYPGGSSGKIGSHGRQIFAFTHRIQKDDWVVMPSKTTQSSTSARSCRIP